MDIRYRRIITLTTLVLCLFILTGGALAQIYGVTNTTGWHVVGQHATATPVLMADNIAGTNVIFEVRDNATPVAAFYDGGSANIAGALTVNSLDVDSGDITLQNDETIANSLNNVITVTTTRIDFTGDARVDDDLIIIAQTAISLTAGVVITPTGTYQQIQSASPVKCDTTECIEDTGMLAGQLLVLHNINSTNPITLDGTGGTVECNGLDQALEAGGMQMYVFDGTDWRCIAPLSTVVE